MASKPSKEETQRQSKNKNASPGTVRQPDSEEKDSALEVTRKAKGSSRKRNPKEKDSHGEKDSALEVTRKAKGSSRKRNPKEKDSHGDKHPRKDNVATLERSEENSSGEEAGSEDLGVNKQNEETPGNDGAKGKSSSPQRTESEQGEASEGIGKPCTEKGGLENLDMSLDYKDSPNTSMVNVFKPLHVPGNNARVTQDKTEMDDQRSDSSGSFVVLNEIETEEYAEIKGNSEDDETKEQEESGAVETDMSGAGQTYVEPFGNMVSDDSSNNKKPNLNEAAQFHVTEVFSKYFLNDVKGNKSLLPQEIRCGPNLCIDRNFIKDEDDKLFEIVKFENGQFCLKRISEGKIANETNVGDETQTVSSLTTTDSVVNASVKQDGAGVVAIERIKSSGKLQGSSMRQKLSDDKIMPEHGHKSLVDAHSLTDNNLDQTKIKQTSDEECRSNSCNDSNSPAHSTVNDVEGSSTQSGRTDVDVDAYNPTDRPLKNVSGVGCQAAAASGHSTSKDMIVISVVVWYANEKGEPTAVRYNQEVDFETKMKLMFVVKQHALFTKKTQKIQDELKVEVDYKDDTFIVKGLKFGENIDKVLDALIQILLENADTLVINEVPVSGLDGEEVCSYIMESEVGQNGNIYSHFNLDKNMVCCIYHKEFERRAEECIRSSVKKTMKEREASKHMSEKKTLSIVFSEDFLSDDMIDKFKKRYQVKLEVEVSPTENCTKVLLSGAEKNVKDASLWITAEYENKFVFNCFKFSEVKLGDKFGDELLDIIEKKCHLLKEENSNLYFYINLETKQITICTTAQNSADYAIISLKKCLREADFNTDDISNPKKIQYFENFAKGLEQNHCKVTVKENIVNIVGLKEDIESAKKCFHEILEEIKEINTAKGAEYQPKSDDSKTSQHTAKSIEKKLEQTTHTSWQGFNGHAVMVVKARAEEFWEEVYVEFEVHGKADQADTQLEFQQTSEAMYKASLQIPQWKGGERKEKHRVTGQFERLLRFMETKGVYKAAVQMHSYGNWPNNTLMKQILKPLNEQQTVPMKILFCCASDDDYQSVCRVCRVVFHEEDKEITSVSTDSTGKALVTKLVKSNLDEYQVDVIVNSANSNLNLSMGRVSQALSERAGSELQSEVNRLHPEQMDDWEILVTQGHRLKCKHVFHGVLPRARDDVQEKVQKLQDFTFTCLRKAAAFKCRSIAFPALGTGKLDYKPENVADAMFSAVDDFRITNRGTSLEEVHFVLYHKDTKVIEAFQKQETLRGPKHVSKDCIFGKVSLKVQLGTIENLRTDSIIYLWQKHQMHSVKPAENTVLKYAGQDVMKKWIQWRDSKGKSKDKAFSTAVGGLKIQILVHVPCSDDKSQLAQHFLKGLSMVDKEKARRVVVYFDQAHPILTKHYGCLGEALVSAVAEYAPHSIHVKDISLMVEEKNRFTPLYQYFTNLAQPSATGGLIKLKEPLTQEISGRDGEPKVTGRADLSDSQTQGDAKAQWNQSNLTEDVDLSRYVIVNEVPERYRQKSLIEDLFKPPFPVAPPSVIYPRNTNKALFICNSAEDAAKLAAFKGHKDFKFRQLYSQSLSNFKSCCGSQMTKLASLQQVQLQEALQGTGIRHDITEDKIVFEAPTTIQLLFAKEKICEITDIPTPNREKHTSTSGLTHVDMFELSELQWDILCAVESETLTELKRGGSIEFNNGKVCQSSDNQLNSWTKFKEVGIGLKNKQTEEIPIQNASDAKDANRWCDEICATLGFKCCIYMAQRKLVAAFCDKYEDLKKVKHQLQVKQGLIKATGRRRNFAVNDESTADTKPVENKKAARSREFNWNCDAQYCRVFTTKEGIVVKVYKANILNLPVDCIVNAANESLNHGGGVAQVIADAAGDALVQDGDSQVRNTGKISVGCAYTTTAGHLDYKCVVHAVGPAWYDYKPFRREDVLACETDLRCAITNSFIEAEKRGLSSIALPAISSAIFRVPEEICAYQYALATVKYSKGAVNTQSCLKEIHFIDIKFNIIQAIQDMFERVLVDDSRPYNIQKYVKRSCSPARRGKPNEDMSSSQYNNNFNNTEKNYSSGSKEIEPFEYDMDYKGFEPLKFESHGRQIFMFGSGQLALCKGDIFQTRADAFVRVVDLKGNGHGHISNVISQTCTHEYRQALQKRFRYQKKSGDVVVTSGFNKDFGKVFHAVYPYDESFKESKHRKKSLRLIYDNILKQAIQEERVNTLSMVLIGTGQDKPYEIKLSAEAFVDSYLVFCNRTKSNQSKDLLVQLVCWVEQKLSTVLSTLDGAIKSLKKSPPPRPPKLDKTPASPGGYPQSKETSDQKYSANEATGANKVQATGEAEEDEVCVICMDTVDNPRVLECGHRFCTDCIEQSLKFKQACPTCGKVCGVLTGDQPYGTMTVGVSYKGLVGYERCGSIWINYRFPAGKQKDHHPNPGQWYEGIQRSGYLPDNREGNIVLEMLRIAFDRKLVFTIGASRTTGQEGVITWNDIHHKTNPNPHGKFGYPDPTYLERVKDELSAKGITEKDILEDKLKEINKKFKGHYDK